MAIDWCVHIEWDIQFNLRIKFKSKAIYFHSLQKAWIKVWVVSMEEFYYSTKHLTTNALYTSLKKAFKKTKAKSQKTSNKSKAPTILVQKDYGTMKKAREKHIAPGKKQAIDELRLS